MKIKSILNALNKKNTENDGNEQKPVLGSNYEENVF